MLKPLLPVSAASTYLRWLLPAVLLCLGSVAYGAPAAYGGVLQRITVKDHLDFGWQHELIVRPLNDEAAQVAQQSGAAGLSLTTAAGEPAAFQLAEIDDRPAIAFFVNLQPLESKDWLLTRADGGAKTATAGFKSVELDRSAADGLVRLANGLVGIALPDGSTDAWENGPIAQLRTASGKWVGQSTLVGEVMPERYEFAVEQSGRLFTDIACTYFFANDETWVIRIRLIAGEPVVLIEEDVSVSTKVNWQFKLDAETSPTHALHRVTMDQTATPTRKYESMVRAMNDLKQALTMRAWSHWWNGYDSAAFMLLRTPKEVRFVDRFEKGWLITKAGNTAAVGTSNLEQPALESALSEMDPTKFQDTLLLGAGRAAAWASESHKGSGRRIAMKLNDWREFEIDLPLQQPGRRWLIGSISHEMHEVVHSELSIAHELILKHFDRPLQRVSSMVLDWPVDESYGRPALLPSGDWLAKLRGDPPRLYDGMPVRKTAKQFLLNPNDKQFEAAVIENAIGRVANSAAGLFLEAMVGSRRVSAMTVAPHEMSNRVHAAVGSADVALAIASLTPEQRKLMRAQLAFTAYNLADENYHSPRLGLVSLPNMTTFTYGTLGALAAVLGDHPEAGQWTKIVEDEFDRELTNWVGPDGGWMEAPHYQTASMEQMLYFGITSQRSGLSDFVYDPRLKDTLMYLARLSTPRDSAFDGRRHFPPIGNTYLNETSNLPAVAAWIWQERDPEYAAQMQWFWHEQGRPRWVGIGGDAQLHWLSDFLYADIEPKPPELGSEVFRGFGVVMRAHSLSERETYLVMHQGPFHSHYDDDQGAFELWGKGEPLSVDWGYNGRMPGSQHNRVTFGHMGRIVRFANGRGADYVRGRQHSSKNGAFWYRDILLAKDTDPNGPNYFVMLDSITPETGPANWHLWLLTETPPAIEGNLIAVTGRNKIDLDIYMPETFRKSLAKLSPKEAKGIRQSERAPQGLDALNTSDFESFSLVDEPEESNLLKTNGLMIPAYGGKPKGGWERMATRQQGISVSVPAGGELLTVMYPREKGEPAPKIKPLPGQVGLEITSQAGTDYVFLSRQRAAVKHQQIEFDGHAGIVQIRGQAVHVTLIGPGMLRYGDVVAEQGDAAVDEMNQASSGQRFDFLKRWPGVHASNE